MNNLEIALTARELNPGIRIVMRMFDQALADKLKESLGIDSVYSTSALSAPVFVQSVISENLLSSFKFGDTFINAYRLAITRESRFLGMKIDDVRSEFEITVLMHQRGANVDWNPPMDIVLKDGDDLLVVTEHTNMKDLIQADTGPWKPVKPEDLKKKTDQ